MYACAETFNIVSRFLLQNEVNKSNKKYKETILLLN